MPPFFLVLVAAAALLVAALIAPLFRELLLALVLASVFRPVEAWLTRRFRGRRAISAGILVFLTVLIVIGPLAGLIAVLVRDGADGVQFVLDTLHSPRVAEIIGWLPESAQGFILDGIERLPRTVGDVVGEIGEQRKTAAAALGASVSATGSILFHGAMMLIALFFALSHGDKMVSWLDSVSPLAPGQTRELLESSKKVSFSIVVSTVATAGVQAIAALVGFYIADVPAPIFFTAVTFVFAFIPAIGAAVVSLAAALLLFVTGEPYMALFVAAWGLVVVGLADNVVKPLLIKRGLDIHGAVVFFSLVGGIAAFGAIGLVIGPLVVSWFLSLISIYHRDYSPQKAQNPSVPGLAPGGGTSGGAGPDATVASSESLPEDPAKDTSSSTLPDTATDKPPPGGG